MKKIPFLILSVLAFACNSGNKEEQKADTTTTQPAVEEKKEEVSLELKWTTDSTLNTCESVLFDKERNILYVTNIDGDPSKKDKNGYISKVSVEGKVDSLKWITGLNAPKGMGLSNGKLYVTDITALVEIDIAKGKVLKKYEVPGSKFLNDITTDSAGLVYFSDSETGKIHVLDKGKVAVWKEGYQQPNGLLAMNNKLYLASMGSSDFKVIDMASKKDSVLATGLGMGDGVIYTGKEGQFIVSNWKGEIFFIKDGQAKKILDTKDKNLNTADIEYISEKNLLLVPTFSGNKVQAYEVKM